MSSIDTRPPFFPQSRTAKNRSEQASELARSKAMEKNSGQRAKHLTSKTAKDAKVNISSGTKDFSRIKRAVDASPPVDNSAKIASLKAQIQAGSYEPDYDAVADKILNSGEF